MLAIGEIIEEANKMVEDLEQITKAQAGDRDALNYLVGKWHPRLSNLFRSKGFASDADDLAQEVLMTMIRKIDQLQEPAAFGGWLRTIASRKISTHLRKRKDSMSLEPDMDFASNGKRHGRTGAAMMSDFEDETLADILRQEDRGQVLAALDELPKEYSDTEYGELARDILVDFYFKNKKIKDIAKDLDRPVGTIKRILHVAKSKLAELLPH